MTSTEGSQAPPRRAWLTVPNALSLLRLASVPVFVWLFVTGREDVAVIIYGIGAWTDFFDGYIARRTGTVTELGKLLDPLADRVLIVALAVALVARDQVLPLWLAIVIVARDVLVLSLFPVLEAKGIHRIPVSFLGKTATASLLLGLTLLAVDVTSLDVPYVGKIGLGFAIFGAASYWAAAFLYGRSALAKLKALTTKGAIRA